MQNAFGSGILIATSLPSTGTATPREFGALQEVGLEINATTKQLMGQYTFPIAVGRGPSRVQMRARTAAIKADLYQDLFFNGTIAAGQHLISYEEAGTVPSTPFQLTAATVTGFEDLGVVNGTTGAELTRKASAPATGEYSVNEGTGVYTFAAADTGLAVRLRYKFTTASSGRLITMSQQLLGSAPAFEVALRALFENKPWYVKFNRCMAMKLSFGTKLDDFMIPEFEFEAFADSAGILGFMSAAE